MCVILCTIVYAYIGALIVLILFSLFIICNRTDRRDRQTNTAADKDRKMARGYLLDQESASFKSALHKQGAQHLYQPFQTIP